jgi:ferredoxin
MKNYAEVLLHEELSADQKRIVEANTRLEWNQRFWRNFIMPAITGIPAGREAGSGLPKGPAEWKVEHFGQVVPIEEVEQVLDRVDSITRLPCGCRFLTTGKTDKRYCFGFGIDKWGILGAFPEAASSLETLSSAEARKIFRSYDEEGLMHSIWSGVTPFVVGACNCDFDCGAYRGFLRGSGNFYRAEYVAQVDWDQCQGCRECMSQCQFGAMFYSSALERVVIEASKCFGCGVCRSACPQTAISLLPREKVPQAAELWV